MDPPWVGGVQKLAASNVCLWRTFDEYTRLCSQLCNPQAPFSELTRVFLPKVRHRQTFEAANFCTPPTQGGSILGAQTSVYGALFREKFRHTESTILASMMPSKVHPRMVKFPIPHVGFFLRKVRHRQTFEHRVWTLPGWEGCKSWRPQMSVYGALLAKIHE